MKRATAFLLVLGAQAAWAIPAQDALAPAGPQSEHILALWHLTLALCTLVFFAVLAAFLWALWRAPRSTAQTEPDLASLTQPEYRVQRTVCWAVGLSAAGLVVLLVADVMTSRALARLPLKDALNIELVGHQWWWEARYLDEDPSRGFTTANELHVPVGRAVILTLKSNDVIHTLWVPNLHGKKDLIPGRTAIIRLRADKAGTYRGQCAEFCGLEHALMALDVVAEPSGRYEQWARRQRQNAPEPAEPLAARGKQVFLSRSCVMCHRVSGTTAGAGVGPDLTHVASRRMIAAGVLPNDRGHLAGWIADPQSLKPGVNMPANPLAPDEMQALLAYLETLR